jgi:hypothetical protein
MRNMVKKKKKSFSNVPFNVEPNVACSGGILSLVSSFYFFSMDAVA